jgi:hypothetical protein
MAALLAGASAVSGCAQISLVTKGIEYMDVAGKIDDAEGVAVEMPSDGAEYDGIVGIGARYRDGGVAMLGDAALTADFDAGTIDGVLDDFVVAEFDGDIDINEFLMNPIGSMFEFETADGQLDLRNGTITGTDFEADFDGNITTDAYVYAADGTLYGVFRGANAELLEAWAHARDMTLLRRGTAPEDVELYLAAEVD